VPSSVEKAVQYRVVQSKNYLCGRSGDLINPSLGREDKELLAASWLLIARRIAQSHNYTDAP
jgi:hypothetical protein